MKRLALIVFLLVFGVAALAQDGLTKVTLKNGATIVGVMKSFNPATEIVIEVAGFESAIPMTDIASIQKAEAAQVETQAEVPASALPAEKVVTIAGEEVKFVLVGANTFNFGYDGPGSSQIDSEPVHEVEISPFYVSERPVSRSLAVKVLGEDPWEGYKFSLCDKIPEYRSVRRGLDVAHIDPKAAEDVAFFYPSFNKSEVAQVVKGYAAYYGASGESFPQVMDFVRKVQEEPGNADVSIMTETQYAAIVNQGISSVDFPYLPEIMKSVSMSVRTDPQGHKLVVKGLSTCVYPSIFSAVMVDGVSIRTSFGFHQIDSKNKAFVLYGGVCAVGPVHLVIPAGK